MIRVYKDWAIEADDNQYKIGTVGMKIDKDTQEQKEVFSVECYANTMTFAIKLILQIEQRRLTSSKDMTLLQAIEEFKKLQEEFEKILSVELGDI